MSGKQNKFNNAFQNTITPLLAISLFELMHLDQQNPNTSSIKYEECKQIK